MRPPQHQKHAAKTPGHQPARPDGTDDVAAVAAAIGDSLLLPSPFRASATPGPNVLFGAKPAGFSFAPPAAAQAAPPPPAPAEPEPERTPAFLFEQALTCRAMLMPDVAAEVLRKLVELKPDWQAAWRTLSDLLASLGDMKGADAAHARAQACPPGRGESARPAKPPSAGKLAQAERRLQDIVAREAPRSPSAVLREHLLDHPTDIAALRQLAHYASLDGDLAAVQALLERVLEISPDLHDTREDLVEIMLSRGERGGVLPHVDRLYAHNPRDVRTRRLRALALASLGEYAAAIPLYEDMLARDTPKDGMLWLDYGRALQYAGRKEDATRAYRTCMKVAPTLGQNYWAFANLKFEPFTADDIADMQARLADPELAGNDRFHFHYSLAWALEKTGAYEESFANYLAGANTRREWRRSNGAKSADAAELTAKVERLKRFFTPALFAARQGQGCHDPAPIFVLGMHRAGSTLIEQILSSHSAIEGTQELPVLHQISNELDASRPEETDSAMPDCLADLRPDQLAELGERYLRKAGAYRKTDRPHFIDKMPRNWEDLGLIQLILPNAKIIDARRNPMDCCFSIFKQLIASGAEYAYDLHALGCYYRDYVDLMAHFDAILPGRVHRVIYEDMVDNTDAEIRRLLDYCGVPFEDSCLRFWETKRGVATPSSEQVRRPIFRDGMGAWKKFEPWLGPLQRALESGGRDWRTGKEEVLF